MYKSLTFSLIFLAFINVFGQRYGRYNNGIFSGRIGVTGGATYFMSDPNYLETKSSVGFSLGLIYALELSDSFDLFIGLNYNRHNLKLLGRENSVATTIEEIGYNLENFSVPVLINYNYYVTRNSDFGISIGPTTDFGYKYNIVDSEKESYLLTPFNINTRNLNFNAGNTNIPINLFLTIGLNAQYLDKFMASVRYHHGLTNPHRNSPASIPPVVPNGTDSYVTLKFTYFFL
ncbi:porin family protein [Tenacibaculum agarivorans]|uniref:porin family protein n=1 Tax=Tenacibaculum agarivorans TaxID=1908389 RepID=UPI00094B9BA0|nr:porin family protein [Tenacibaculum agarivorans]